MKQRKALGLIIIALAAAFLSLLPQGLSADEPLDSYIEALAGQLEREAKTLRDFIEAYNSLGPQNAASFSAFGAKLRPFQTVFEESATVYGRPLPPGTPTSLRAAVLFARTASQDLLNATLQFERAIRERDQAGWASAETRLEQGKNGLGQAIGAYNDFVAENRRRQESVTQTPRLSDESPLATAFRMSMNFGTPLLYAYVYLILAGLLLSWYFRAKLDTLVRGLGARERFKGSGLYGLHLALLFPYLYALLAFSVLLVFDFAFLSFSVLSNLRRIPIALAIALLVVVAGSLWGIVRGFIGTRRKVFGLPCLREEEPEVWSLCDKVAMEVGTKPMDKLLLSPRPGIGVYLDGGLVSTLFGRTNSVLNIGIPSVVGLSVSELQVILAHEFGHFSNRDTTWNSVTFTMAAALNNVLSTMPSPWRAGNSFWIMATSTLNPALWALLAYRFLFLVITRGFSRMREILADKLAISLFGCGSFTSGLMKVARNDYVFDVYFLPETVRMLMEEKKVFTNVFRAMEERIGSLDYKVMASLDASLLGREKRSAFDTHPTLRERMAYAKRFEVAPKYPAREDDVKALFTNWDATAKSMSDMHNYYVAVLSGVKD